ncbi:uncharacterized protein LOC111632039 [Centruroides sculpturatus]|uniref:uncharacterized protein LOC111632039 n=1 Tax=Centruroides sculpturatus TaxID=218467 RepID=UPI000C6D0F96|nr:uncharacterized protein LOC111632039 [Centruroides sculpturatus]
MDQQVRDFLTHCSAADTPTPSGHPQPSTSCLGNRILSRNANGTIAMTSQPTNESELQLYRVLQRANLLSYYDTFICQGGDDVQQLCEAGEEEFLEIMALVGMASKPLHVRRLQKALQEWVNNPAMFQTPLVPAVPPTHPNYPVNHMSSRPSSVTQSPLSMRPSPPMPMVSNNSQSSPSPGSKDVPSPSQIHQQREHQLPHLQQLLCTCNNHETHRFDQFLMRWLFDFNANDIAMTSQPTNESELQLYRVLQRANLLSYYDTFICQGGDDVQQLCEAGEEEFLEIMALVGMASKPLHVRRLQKALQEWVNNPVDDRLKPKGESEGKRIKESIVKTMFQTPLVPAVPPTHPNYPVNHMSSRPSSVTQSPLSMRPSPPMPMVSNNSQSSPSPGSKDVPSPSQIHQQREHQLPHLQQEFWFYKIGKSNIFNNQTYNLIKCYFNFRSQCYTKTCDEELCKRARLDPNLAHDKSHVEEVKKRRQERIEAIGEQLKSLGTQQEELKTCLQQAREVQNFNAVNQIQTQLEQVATQQMQLISEQSEINKQLRRIDRYFLGKNYNVRSSCSEAEKIDTDDTDSQFSIYSNASSPTLSHDAHDSPSRDSNQSSQASDMYNTMKMVSGKKANSQITKQLVQETLMDEGLRVVKELASQIREDTEIPIPISKPEGRPRGRPPRLERDYLVSTAGATGGIPITSLSTAISLTSSTSPLASAQNGHCLITMNGPSDNYSASRPNGMMLNNSGLHNSNDANDKTDSSEIGKSPENSLNALLALSQKGVKQEPPSPNSTGKME